MPVVDPRIAGKPVPRISKETIERECVARVQNVKALDVGVLRPTHSALRARHHQYGRHGRHRECGTQAEREGRRVGLLGDLCARQDWQRRGAPPARDRPASSPKRARSSLRRATSQGNTSPSFSSRTRRKERADRKCSHSQRKAAMNSQNSLPS
jgi:hypothetical protein